MNQPQQEEKLHQKRTIAEWVTFSVASSILIGVVGLVSFTWIVQSPQQPPILVITNNQPLRRINGQYYIPFEIVNQGGETAASVQVIAELRINGKVEETGEQQIQFLSKSEKEMGAFIFTQNPEKGELILRVASYKSP
ncbi:MAG: TIGR02588 family protein [Richelia sp. RM2_1_2]|nr:TIGR02588 family protein [Richelia sp. SM2_1_7]NJM22153.1 TIGR02588 family protein [Richelia sp. SM1_7_0]NJN07949.1 TIGR02588 family protein [Richelia sp. RM1_1_1]NJO30514.1 TIGR02588 family protein [Richelia sp. SL_2_1]NJO61691.1 TIGR02588 family protein [Richelia sp. RM2_1_2]